ncbi:hypothetical protein ABTW96_08670 [Nocardia beijingensis]|uniref:hypothetical protein n=1 Tax=Nocardia beijingensis TaxID=95162 RepID=UPI0033286F84
MPAGLVFIPIEIKDIRDWVYPRYPRSAELYQLLHKAALLQFDAPEANIMPVLVCRRVNHTLWFLAQRLGFKVHDTRQQYIRSVVTDDDLTEVRTELGFRDLMKPNDKASLAGLNRFFLESLAVGALDYADRWREAVLVHNFDEYFRHLRLPTLRYIDRTRILTEFRTATEAAGMRGGW